MAYDTLKQIVLFLRGLLDVVIDFVFSLVWERERRAIPDLEAKHGVLAESAVALAAKIRSKKLRSEELVQTCVERIKIVNPFLNAVIDERFEDALKEAREVDKQIANGLSDEYFKQKPFLGVPFTTKESFAVAGMLHCLGITARRGMRANTDAECVRLLRASGAIPIAVTNVPELNKWQESRNPVFGQTNNPYHTGCTPGGSSGGEAALAAAFGSPISLCSDIAGSTRIPAFYCGLFGHNPSAGHTSFIGVSLKTKETNTVASAGFVSKHCEDLAPLVKVIAGEKAPLLDLDRKVNLKDLKFYYTEATLDIKASPICKDLRDAMTRVITKLTEEASSTDRAPQPYHHEGLDHMFDLWKHAMTLEGGNFPLALTNNQYEANGFVELAKKLVGQSQYTWASIMKLLDDPIKVNKEWAEDLTKQLADDIYATLGSDGVLLFPSAPAPAPYHAALLLRPCNWAYWCIFNVLRMPSTQVPLGLNSSGLPIGIQVVAAPRRDALCLAVAEYLGAHFGGFVPPCKVKK